MKIGKILLLLIMVLLLYLFLNIYPKYKKKNIFKADWIIVRIEQDSINIMPDLSLANCLIDLNAKNIHWPIFKDLDVAKRYNYIQEIDVKVEKEGVIVISHDYDIFQDTFLLNCLDDECCRMSMKSRSLYIELIYNGNYNGIGRSRNCPNAKKVIKNMEAYD